MATTNTLRTESPKVVALRKVVAAYHWAVAGETTPEDALNTIVSTCATYGLSLQVALAAISQNTFKLGGPSHG